MTQAAFCTGSSASPSRARSEPLDIDQALDAYVLTIDETDAKVKSGQITSRQAEADVDRAFAAMRDALGRPDA